MKRNATQTVFAVAAFAVTSGWTNGVCAVESATSNTGSATATPKKMRAKRPRLYDASTTTTATSTTAPKAPRVRGTAYTRVVHAIAGGPAVDIYVDGKKVLSDVRYKSVSDYLALPTGKHVFKITKSGATDTFLSSELTSAKDKFYTVAAYGTLEKPLLLRVNEATGKQVEGKSRVYVVHLAQAPAVDVTTPSSRNKTTGFASFLKAVPPGTARAKTASPGEVTLQIRADGKIVKQADAKIDAGKRYTGFRGRQRQ